MFVGPNFIHVKVVAFFIFNRNFHIILEQNFPKLFFQSPGEIYMEFFYIDIHKMSATIFLHLCDTFESSLINGTANIGHYENGKFHLKIWILIRFLCKSYTKKKFEIESCNFCYCYFCHFAFKFLTF